MFHSYIASCQLLYISTAAVPWNAIGRSREKEEVNEAKVSQEAEEKSVEAGVEVDQKQVIAMDRHIIRRITDTAAVVDKHVRASIAS